MDTLRSIMQKVDALTNAVALLRAENKALASELKSIKDKPVVLPTKQIKQITISDVNAMVTDEIGKIKQPNTLTSDDVIFNIKKVVNIDYVNNLYRK